MNSTTLWLRVGASFAAGALVGWLYFRGLRLTLERLPGSARPGTLVLLSLVVRTAAAGAAFALIAHLAQGPGLAAALLAFIGVRTVVVRRTRREALLAKNPRKSP